MVTWWLDDARRELVSSRSGPGRLNGGGGEKMEATGVGSEERENADRQVAPAGLGMSDLGSGGEAQPRRQRRVRHGGEGRGTGAVVDW